MSGDSYMRDQFKCAVTGLSGAPHERCKSPTMSDPRCDLPVSRCVFVSYLHSEVRDFTLNDNTVLIRAQRV